jgi:preprotein translocase SecF subunit
MKQLFLKANYPFMAWRKKAFLFSGTLMVISLITVAVMGGPKYSIDFTGGVLVQLAFEKPVEIEQVRNALTGVVGLTDYDLQQFGGENRLIFRTAEMGQEDIRKALDEKLRVAFPDNPFTQERVEAVGPKVGAELREKAVLAVLYGMVGILIYVAFRFEFHSGVAAVIAVFHDVIITFCAVVITGREISIAVIAALLTIVGYSINDTIVIFDRIREGVGLWRKDPYDVILNRSINQTLSRTVVTGGTTLVSLLFLFLLGGEVLRDFSFTLLVGIVFGTYSSVFVASAILLEWRNVSGKKKKQ